jgi:hypothetical protein
MPVLSGIPVRSGMFGNSAQFSTVRFDKGPFRSPATSLIRCELSEREETMRDMIAALCPVQTESARALPCGDWLRPVPADTDHDGWACVRSVGHLSEHDHMAEDGTTW